MAGTINWDSVLKKAKTHMERGEVKRKVAQKRDEYMLGDNQWNGGRVKQAPNVNQAGLAFRRVLLDSIESSDLPDGVVRALSDIDVTTPSKGSDGTYYIRVYFEDPERETMSTHKKYYPISLDELYNDGVDHVMQQIFETIVYKDEEKDEETQKTNNNKLYVSSPIINGTHFMEQAVVDFMGNYASDFNVIDIHVNKHSE